MSLAESMLPELDQEFATTRRVLERVPGDKFDYKPHAKSYSLGQLASHLALLLTWMGATVNGDEFDMADTSTPRPTPPTNQGELMAAFDKMAKEAREALAGADDACMMGNWTLKSGEQVFFTMPRVAVIRSFVMNHLIHHRGQLTVYLRMCDVALPQVYGPTADESGM